METRWNQCLYELMNDKVLFDYLRVLEAICLDDATYLDYEEGILTAEERVKLHLESISVILDITVRTIN